MSLNQYSLYLPPAQYQCSKNVIVSSSVSLFVDVTTLEPFEILS